MFQPCSNLFFLGTFSRCSFLLSFFFKIIKGKEDARSVVRYQFKEPFVTKTLQIFPDVDISQPVDLRTEVYGCRPTLGNGIISLY